MRQVFVGGIDMSHQLTPLTFHAPEKLTKQLSIKQISGGKRKVVISTNWLPLVGFEKGDPTIERTLGEGKGFVIERVRNLFDNPKIKKVYSREYKSRKNNPIETLLDISSQKLLDMSIPVGCERVHVTFKRDIVTVVPITSGQYKAIQNAKSAQERLSVFAGMTSGVDLQSLQSNGFTVSSILEWRCPEKRDGVKDLSETGALAAIANTAGVKNLYNENIFEVDVHRLAEDAAKSPFTLFHASPQCDDHSSLKTKKSKAGAVSDLSTTIDMAYDVIRICEELNPPTILLENVPNWLKSDVYTMLSVKLRRFGYKEHVLVGDARDYGGLTSRKRAYSFFTALPSHFAWEAPQSISTTSIWTLIDKHLPECRDVTHSKSLQDGITTGRLRPITPESNCAPTLLKSQERMAKDSVVIKKDGRLYWPTEKLLKELMGIEQSFDLRCVTKAIASEIIGQSVDIPLHDAVVRSAKRHINAFFDSLAIKPTMVNTVSSYEQNRSAANVIY
jgi:DNA (cytosine-5)-methyltransferase 1